ncbi:MAG TPA: phage tail tape measure protein [Pseudolabrys sp.]|nr:phage tail tape measure protein [Pseudolabrys sp.]
MSFLDSGSADALGTANDLSAALDGVRARADGLSISAAAFSVAMTRAFSQAASGGKQFDDVLKSLALRISSLTVAAAFQPIAGGIAGGLNQIVDGLFGGGGGPTAMKMGGIKPFASGGVIGTPTYFPLATGGFGLAGEAGPEAIMPLTRGPDGRLGVAMNGGAAPANVTVQIATPDAASFRRSEAYLTGQIARAVARGQRNL